MYQNGGKIIDDLQNPTKVIYDDPQTIEALQWYDELFILHDAAPTGEQAE